MQKELELPPRLDSFGDRLYHKLKETALSRPLTKSKHIEPLVTTTEMSQDEFALGIQHYHSMSNIESLYYWVSLYSGKQESGLIDRKLLNIILTDAVDIYRIISDLEFSQIVEFGYCKENDSDSVEDSSENSEPDEKSNDLSLSTELNDKGESEEPNEADEKKPVKKYNMNFVVPGSSSKSTECKSEKIVEKETKNGTDDFFDVLKLDMDVLNAIEISILQKKDTITTEEFVGWWNSHCKYVSRFLSQLITLKIVDPLSKDLDDEKKLRYRPMTLPFCRHSLEGSQLDSNTLLWSLDHLIERDKSWKLLFSSRKNGRSLNRFSYHVVGYSAPTILFIYTKNQDLFGAYTDSNWEPSGKYSGTYSFLFSCTTKFSICKPTGTKQNFTYFYTNKKSFNKYPVGIGFGGEPGNFRLWIDEDLETGIVRNTDATFETGSLCSESTFDIASIEVWGCGEGEKGLIREHNIRNKEQARANNLRGGGKGWSKGSEKFIMDLVGRTGSSDGFLEEMKRSRKSNKK